MFLTILLAVGSLADPSLKGLIVQEIIDIGGCHGNLQGTITSLRTLATAIGSLVISALFAYSISTEPTMPYLCFTVAAGVYLMIALFFSFLFQMKDYA